jgi:YHS domain-containing protein
MVRDPVCGMVIAEAHAQAVRQVQGATVYFCSAACAQQFDAPPQQYAAAAGCARTPHGGWLLSRSLWPLQRPMMFGLLAMVGLLAFYLGIITLAQGWSHAIEQLAADRWFVGVIAAGFGIQVGLFTYLRGLHAHMTPGGVAASTGTSTAAMLACCAHHLVDILPIVGVAGAAAFLNAYKIPMLWLGIVMNLIGIIYLLRKIAQHRAVTCHTSIATRSLAP